jgi:hypothetical protein
MFFAGRAKNILHVLRQPISVAICHLCIPAVSAETEWVFRDTNIYLSTLRNRLGVDIAEV